MLLAACLLAAIAVLLAWPVPLTLARSTWTDRAPGTALVLWQAIALAGVLSLIGSLTVLGLAPYGPHPAAAARGFADAVTGGVAPVGWTYPSVVALSAALLLGGHLLLGYVATLVRSQRQRTRHRDLLLLLSAPLPDTPRTRVLDASAPIAYCLPGSMRTLTVLSAGLLRLLDAQEVRGVVEHERAHLRQRHWIVLDAFRAWRVALPWFPVARRAQDAVGLLTEMLADDVARRAVPAPVLASAIASVAAGDAAADSPAADPEGVARRVRRLLDAGPAPIWLRVGVPAGAVLLVALPPLIVARL